MTIAEDLQKNYRDLHDGTGESYGSIARRVEEHGDRHLGAWLREQAAAAGEDITPYAAIPAEPTSERDYSGKTNDELKSLLAERGIEHKASKKEDLIAELEAADQAADAPSTAGEPAAAAADDDEYGALTDDEVRELATQRNVDPAGTRAELVARLQAAKE